jgi:hypothetical protein
VHNRHLDPLYSLVVTTGATVPYLIFVLQVVHTSIGFQPVFVAGRSARFENRLKLVRFGSCVSGTT